jgi:Na+-transporting methylmalonyl-CoA/oxaloacetate decarboxylase gamma subunit
MTLTDALLVTALGLGVVFAGLVLCVGFIDLFRRVGARVSSEAGAAATGRLAAPEEPVPADVLAVIVAVLEVERALYVGRYRPRLTLRRAPASGNQP